MSTSTQTFKYTAEALNVEVDMLSRLAIGELAVTAAAVMSVHSGVDANPGATLIGLPTISGSIITQDVIGGLAGVIYKLSVSVRTSLGQILVNEVKIAVLSTPAVAPPP